MEGFMNLAKKGYEAYEESQQKQGGGGGGQSQGNNSQSYGNANQNNYGSQNQQGQGSAQQYTQGGQGQGQQQQQQQQQGGPQFNSGNQPGSAPDVSDDDAIGAAQNHAGDSGSSDLFTQGLAMAKQFGFANSSSPQNVQVDESGIQQAHDEAYNKGNAGSMSSSAIGSAAAMQAMKMFMGSNSGSSGNNSSGGGMMSKIIGMAMAEAAKMFDQNGSSSGTKQDAISSASTTIMSLMMKSQMSGSTGTGGLGGLMAMAGKFM